MESIMQYRHPANHVNEALPLGNGSFGAVVYGKTETEKISLNHDTLWSGTPKRHTRPQAQDAYQKAQARILAGDIKGGTELLERDFCGPFGQSYLPLGDLYIKRLYATAPSAYHRELNLETSIVTVRYEEEGIRFKREIFVSFPDRVLVVHLSSSTPCDYAFSMGCQVKNTITAENGVLRLMGECPSYASPEYAQHLGGMVYDGTGVQFAAMGSAITDGAVETKDAEILVKDATETTFLLCAETSFIDFDHAPQKAYAAPCRAHLDALLSKTYEEIKAAHVQDVSAFYNRVKLDLKAPASSLMTDERLRSPHMKEDLGLIELRFNFGRYLVIASSRAGSQATNLQGIWNEALYACWSSNYTVNINTQMNYWPVLMCNLAEMHEPLFDLIQKIRVTGRDVARDFYGAEGFCAHHNIDLWGLASPVGANQEYCAIYGFWSLASGWLCRHLWEHYEYTLDTEFLKKTAYPIMCEAAEFYLSVLIPDGDRYILCPATSPENFYYYKGEKAWVARYTTMSQAIIMDLFMNISRAAEVLHIENDFVARLRDILPKLNTYAVGAEGQLLEFDDDYPEVDPAHRHISHLYGLYPGESITVESTPELAEACRKTLLKRGDQGHGGWSQAWRMIFWAKLKNGNKALSQLHKQLTYVEPTTTDVDYETRLTGTYPNLFDGPPFQIDGTFGAPAAITQLFLQCEDGKIRILPALPDALKDGSISGLKAKGNVTVDITWKDGKLTQFALCSPVAQEVTVATPEKELRMTLVPNQKVVC